MDEFVETMKNALIKVYVQEYGVLTTDESE